MNLKAKADAVFSRWIRRRDCPDGCGMCISCGRSITPETCDCGHFIPRANTSTRFYERNCAAQCISCNRYSDGNLAGFTIGLVERYGDGVVDELNALKHTSMKFSPGDYKELIEKYRKL